jgi:hypothetical protein
LKSNYTEDAGLRSALKSEVEMAVDKAKEIAERSRKEIPEDTTPIPEIEAEEQEQSLEDMVVPIN